VAAIFTACIRFVTPLATGRRAGWHRLLLTLSTGRNTLYDDITVTRASAVPEPVTPALLLAGLGLMGLVARRRRI
jgi:hypothetical protein